MLQLLVKTPDGRPYTKKMNLEVTVEKKATAELEVSPILKKTIAITNGVHDIEISPESHVDYYQLRAYKVQQKCYISKSQKLSWSKTSWFFKVFKTYSGLTLST